MRTAQINSAGTKTGALSRTAIIALIAYQSCTPPSLANPTETLTWTPVQESSGSTSRRPAWEPLPMLQENVRSIEWVVVDENEPDDAQTASLKPSSTRRRDTRPKPVTGGVFHIKRNDEFLPAITHFIPSGYGASFGHVSMGLWVEDCLTAGGKLCGGKDKNIKSGGQNWVDEFEEWGKGRVVTEIGLGDPNRWFGLDAAFQFTSLVTNRPGQKDGTPFGSGQGLDLSISRNITPDWGIKIGARNIAKFDNVQLDSGRSAYGVMSMRVDLGGDPSENTNDLYLTWGLGNGRMRPLDVIVADQTKECNKDMERYGRRTESQYVVHCLELALITALHIQLDQSLTW